MSEEARRPGQATIAAWLIIGGSVIVVVTAWARIANLHTLEVQDQLRESLSKPPLDSWGLDLQQLETILRIGCMVAAGAATATGILGLYALRRSTSARLALTLLTPLLVVGGLATAAGYSTPIVLFGIVMLWLRPTRDWFAGRPWVVATPAHAQRRPDPFAPQPARPEVDDHVAPRPEPAAPPPSPSRPAEPPPFRGEYGAPLPEPGAPGPPPSPYGVPARRPGALVGACIIVWAASTLVSGFMLLFSLIMAVARDDFFDEIRRQQPDFDMKGMSEAELAMGTFVATAFVVMWCIAAIVLAVLAFRRIRWARVALIVSTGIAGLVLLGLTFLSPLLVVLLAADVVTLWLLLRVDVTAWYRR